MRKILVLTVSLIGSFSFAQTDAVLDILAKESCECIKSKKNIDLSKPDPELIKKEFGICVLQSYSKNSEAFGKEHPLDVGNRDAMVKLGEQVGMKMLGFCPEVLMALAGDDEEEASPEVTYQQIEGQLSEIKTEQFVTFVVRDKNGRNYNFLMLDYFETASLYTNNQIKKNDKLVISYSEVELYDPKAKEFRYFKVITGLEKK